MFEYLKRLAARLRGRLPAVEPPREAPPQDPESHVREPRRRGPGGRDSAVAVEEPPQPSQSVQALGRARRR
jgi:hypothetical protein